MIYILIILLTVFSFVIITLLKKKHRRYKKVKPLSKISKKEFKKAMKDLEIRKQQNRKKNIEYTKKYIASARKQKSRDLDYAILRQAHEQASRELSGGRKPINNRAFRDWNPSIYKYDKKTKSYILKKNIIAGADVPKRINWQ